MSDPKPEDETIESAIVDAVAHHSQPIRPNKLRKIICKNVKGTDWTQYQNVLDLMVKEGRSIQTCVFDNENMITLKRDVNIRTTRTQADMSQSSIRNTSEVQKKSQEDEDDTQNVKSTSIKVPLAILYHLVRKGNKKQKSLEENTKTLFNFSDESLKAVKKKGFLPTDMCSFTIKSLVEDDEMAAKKHIKTAKILINKMVKSFEINPDHFNPKKAGGTFKEQEEAKKKRIESNQKRKMKDKVGIEDANEEPTRGKKRKRKFY